MLAAKLALTRFFEHIWYRPQAPLWAVILLKPLECLFCWVSQQRRIKHSLSAYQAPVPVVVIGNISVGGTGKTPLLIRLVVLFQEHGYQPAVISRGYAAKHALVAPLLVTPQTATEQAGDEPVLIAKRTQVPVCVYPKRSEAIQTLLQAYPGCNVILSDDGLQHYAMARDIEIVVVDGERKFGNGQCLPLGPLRETISRLQQADFTVINNGAAENAFSMQMQGAVLYALNKPNQTLALAALKGQTVQVITALGNPARLVKQLETAGLHVQLKRFPDHYAFQAQDLVVQGDLPLIMTEKDAVKCQGFTLPNAWYLPITAQLESEFEQKFLQRLQEVAACKKSY